MAQLNKYIVLIVVFCTNCQISTAQFNKYIIQLKDKSNNPFTLTNPSQFLSAKALQRRQAQNIPLNQTDLPITPQYINTIAAIDNVTILSASKWFNQVCIKITNPTALTAINALPFVQTSVPVAPRPIVNNFINKLLYSPITPIANTQQLRPQQPNNVFDYGQAFSQIQIHNGQFLHNQGFTGKGMQVAIMDAGFQRFQNIPTFDSVMLNNQIVQTWDFVANKATVNEEHPHGMHCFSTMAANNPGVFVGTVPHASFYLYRTEDAATEYPIEEHFFAAAAEKADSAGVDVFSISLGYTKFDNSQFDYSYADMNGKTTTIAKACTMAANKGIAVVAAAGNEGGSSWRYITTPGDADSVLTVGAIGLDRQAAYFSSYGPTSDGRVKPDIVAIGSPAIIANSTTGLPLYGSGTSYATPIMAGITTCLWQAFPEVNNMAICKAVNASADNVSLPNNRIGYGVPDAKKAFVHLVKQLYNQQIIFNNCVVQINGNVNASNNSQLSIERKLAGQTNYSAIYTKNFTGAFGNQNFTFNDSLQNIMAPQNIAYRVKMTIGTDTSFYLDSALVNYLQACNNSNQPYITIAPNPINTQLSIFFVQNEPSVVDVEVHTIDGRQLSKLSNQQIAPQQVITLAANNWAKGVYIVTVYKNKIKVLSKKVVKI